MRVEINHMQGKYATGCLTTSEGKLWAKGDLPWLDKPQDPVVEIDLPDDEAQHYISEGLCREVPGAKEESTAAQARRKARAEEQLDS